MQLNVYPVIMLLVISLFASCKKDIAYENDFSRSENVWKKFKASSGNSYRYMVTNGSWAGTLSETIVTVENGRVMGRSYLYKVREVPNGPLVIRDQWEEDASSLGSHQQGAAQLTLDEIYQRAENDWLKKRDDAESYFETKNGGMISLCGYVKNGCMDDCFIGVTIAYIEKL
ncbi:hypothetical protein L3C95_09495 [Chitinophaga filiformis]|uniref:hypothetical protein n=1 Tax=Chitinophaga filiformis TaxID=104663 RepID=UPI001F360E6D|nr:hypothetical protein [Chitinophaga filiformis]MCF6403107.1 hypothetical protein [Chitinophaga filiformis]